jgi:hypothetical protein
MSFSCRAWPLPPPDSQHIKTRLARGTILLFTLLTILRDAFDDLGDGIELQIARIL